MKKGRTRQIKVLLADDHPIVREGIKSHLATQPSLKVVADVSNGEEALRKARQHQPDVVLMDISMPRMNGLEAITRLRRSVPQSKILVLSMHDNREYISQVLRLGARGYVLKDTAPSELIKAINMVYQGEVYLGPAASKILLDELTGATGQPHQPAQAGELSDREREVLVLIAEGHSNKQIASRLGVSVRTIETHRERVMDKLAIHTVAGLTKFAILCGLVPLR